MSQAACKTVICQDEVGLVADTFCQDAVASAARTASRLAKQLVRNSLSAEAIVAAEEYLARAHSLRLQIEEAAEEYLTTTNVLLEKLTDDIE